MSKKSKVDESELELFYRSVQGVKPLVHKKTRLKISHKPIARLPSPPKEAIHFDEKEELAKVGSEEFIAYKQASISNKILRKLRKGQYNVEAKLDLHGLTGEKAKQVVETFIQDCLQEGLRVALIIHGKGRLREEPILKNKLNRWLRTSAWVLAFCSAASFHGSRGAVYVLLKRATEEKFFD